MKTMKRKHLSTKRAVRSSGSSTRSASTRLNRPRVRAAAVGKKRMVSTIAQGPDYLAGAADGKAWRSDPAFQPGPEAVRIAIRERWSLRFRETKRNNETNWALVRRRGLNYAAGFMQGSGARAAVTPVPLNGKAAAIVFAGMKEEPLRQVLDQLQALPLDDVVIVASNPAERLFALARGFGNVTLVSVPEPLDADVGRALGAKLTGADTILFLDGEQAVSADQLAGFIWACQWEMDIALNDISAQMGLFRKRGGNERLFEFLNVSLQRGDLKINTLSALPYAVSRRAIESLGIGALAVPIKAHAQAILNGLRIGIGGAVGGHRQRRGTRSDWRRAAGDHAEAWREAFDVRGNRLDFADWTRNRSLLGDWEP
ncbi:hypothetical protein [Cohnella boryungensis]|uniref:Glycosyl transferase family 2 n=1 Tax=Cohnella boryungensis TaxID=768479 RepID=A0ABV8SB34_9BACL